MDAKLKAMNRKMSSRAGPSAPSGGVAARLKELGNGDVVFTNFDESDEEPPVNPAVVAREKRIAEMKERKQQRQEAAKRAKEIMATTPEVKGGIESRFAGANDATIEEKLKQQTYGLMSAEEFQRRQEDVLKAEEARKIEESNKAEAAALRALLAETPLPPPTKKAKPAKAKPSALSFTFEDE